MTPLSCELQSLKEAASAAIDCTTKEESAARTLSARIFVECGQGGWLAMAREFATIRASMAFPEERYADEIAVLKNEDAVAIPPESQDIDIKKVLEALRTEKPEEIDRRIAEALPADSVVWSRNTGFQVKGGDGLWHWNFGGKHFTCNALRHPGLYAVVIRGEAKDTTPHPGDRLTAAQLRDAPDGTIVETNNNRSVYITKKGATWHDGGGFEWPALDDIYFLVSWGGA